MGSASALRAAWNAAFGASPGIQTADTQASEKRSAERRETLLSAEVLAGGRVYQAKIRNISTGGLTLAFPSAPTLFKGAHLLVRAPGFAPISGSVRWYAGQECGMAFNIALAERMLNDVTALFGPGKRPRPARARVYLPATARFGGHEQRVTLENIGPGGALVSSDTPLHTGNAVMLGIDGLLPIGGYVRWNNQACYGVMFSKLLPIVAAEEIAGRCSLHLSWLQEVIAAHKALIES